MRNWWCSIVLAFFLLGLSVLVSSVRDSVFAQQTSLGGGRQVVVNPSPEPPRWLVDFSSIDDPANPSRKTRVVTVVDPESKCILVYHVDMATGGTKLLSARDMKPDIMIGEYNAISPTPGEIEAEIRRLRKR